MRTGTGPRPRDVPPLREAFRQFGRLVKLIRPYWGLLLKGAGLNVVVGITAMVVPYLSKLLIDEVYGSNQFTLMHVLVGGILVVQLSSAFIGTLRSYFTLHASTRLSNATGLLFFNHLQHLPARFFEEHRVGEIMSRFGDVRSSLASVANIFSTVFVQGTYLILVPPLLFLLEWRLALVALVTLPLSVLITTWSARILRDFHKRTAEEVAELSAIQIEVLSQIRTLKVLAREHAVYSKARDQMRVAMRQQLRTGALSAGFSLATGAVSVVGTGVITWYAWTLILEGSMSLGDYIAFMAYLGYMTGPLQRVTTTFAGFQQTAVNLGRMFEYLDTPTEQDPSLAYDPSPYEVGSTPASLRLAGVTFGYTPDVPVLEDVSLSLAPGSVTSVVGLSGAGKSSLVRLFCRLDEPWSGNIYLDGVPMDRLPLAKVRRQMSVVWQEFSLLNGSIWDNLTLGVSDRPLQEKVDEVARLCRLDEFIAALPLGYDSPVGEWGATLSGGQRQRLAIARALLCETPLLILDEATSNIDVETEAAILTELFASRERRTTVYVTHRIASARLADRILVVNDRKIVGDGSHDELVETCATYRRLLQVPPRQDPPPLRFVGPASR